MRQHGLQAEKAVLRGQRHYLRHLGWELAQHEKTQEVFDPSKVNAQVAVSFRECPTLLRLVLEIGNEINQAEPEGLTQGVRWVYLVKGWQYADRSERTHHYCTTPPLLN